MMLGAASRVAWCAHAPPDGQWVHQARRATERRYFWHRPTLTKRGISPVIWWKRGVWQVAPSWT